MSQEANKFLQAEQSALDLLDTLDKLKEEAVSYKTSADALDAVRVKLVGLIGAVQMVAKDSHEAVLTMKDIGGPQILQSIDTLSRKVTEQSEIHNKQVASLKPYLAAALVLSVFSFGLILVLLSR